MRWMMLAAGLMAAGCAVSTSTPEVASQGKSQGNLRLAAAPAPAVSLNEFRTANGRQALKRSPRLQAAAEAHARDMARMGRMTHRGSNGSEVSDRVLQQGYRFGRVAENIAETGRGPDRVMDLWINSPSHRRNMLIKDVTHYGMARNGDYYSLVVARRR